VDTMPAPPAPAPFAPSAPPTKHMAHWKIILTTAIAEFVILGVVGAITNIGAKEPVAPIPVASAPAEVLPSITESPGITAAMVVDATAPEKIAAFCRAYEEVGNYSAALEAFSSGYHSKNPPASEVFAELVSRCP
jgi:hypothetical protein